MEMQNREMIMHKVGKWFMIIGIAGLLSLLFIEWSRWNLVPLAEKIKLFLKKFQKYLTLPLNDV